MMNMMLSGWMLYAMWAVLGLMALDFLVGLYKSMRIGDFSPYLITKYMQDMLYYVLPLYMLSNMMSIDYTGFLMMAGYYIGAIGVMLKYMYDIKKKF